MSHFIIPDEYKDTILNKLPNRSLSNNQLVNKLKKVHSGYLNNSLAKQKENVSSSQNLNKNNFLENKTNYYKYRNIVSSKVATKSISNITSFGVNSHNGNVRNYNEDRVSIIINAKNPNPDVGVKWPKVSYFAIFDGHSGNKCADFLKDNLHNFVTVLLILDI
jgi:protein phosphatase 2C family protein 2/3